jgi:HEAT repeat protein
MFLDPNKLGEASPADILEAAAKGHLGLDQRFLHALLDRREGALPAVLAFADRDRREDAVDIAPELIQVLRYWKTPEAVPFLVHYIREDPEEVPDEAVEALVEIGPPALEPLLDLYEALEESESGEVAFILANLRMRDERILKILIDRIDYDVSDTLLLLSVYGDPAAIPTIEAAAAELGPADKELKKEVADALKTL